MADLAFAAAEVTVIDIGEALAGAIGLHAGATVVAGAVDAVGACLVAKIAPVAVFADTSAIAGCAVAAMPVHA